VTEIKKHKLVVSITIKLLLRRVPYSFVLSFLCFFFVFKSISGLKQVVKL
jgi:hypothetical protein